MMARLMQACILLVVLVNIIMGARFCSRSGTAVSAPTTTSELQKTKRWLRRVARQRTKLQHWHKRLRRRCRRMLFWRR